MLYDRIQKSKDKMVSVLIDPDKHNEESLLKLVTVANETGVNFFLIGGSIISKTVNDQIVFIKKNSLLPVFLFPGNLLQLCDEADRDLL